MAVCGLFLNISATTVAAQLLAGPGDGAWATLPIGLYQLTSLLAMPFLARWMKAYGRRLVYMVILPTALAGAGLAALAAQLESFALLALAAAIQGPAFASANAFRFASVDFALQSEREAALSATVLGGAVGAIGPFLGSWLRVALPKPFVATYFALMGCYVLEIVLVMLVHFAAIEAPQTQSAVTTTAGLEPGAAVAQRLASAAGKEEDTAKDLSVLKSQSAEIVSAERSPTIASSPVEGSIDSKEAAKPGPLPRADGSPSSPSAVVGIWTADFTGASIISAVAYMTMVGLMTSTPLAMLRVGLTFEQTVAAVSAHTLGMYIPSLFSGRLAKAVGGRALAVAGAATLTLGNAVFLMSTEFGAFVAAICIVGVGWNGAYVGTSALMPSMVQAHASRLHEQGTTTHAPEDVEAGVLEGEEDTDRVPAATMAAAKASLQGAFDTANLATAAVTSLVTGLLFAALEEGAFWGFWMALNGAMLVFSIVYWYSSAAMQSAGV
jgi:MFS family permease